MKARIFTGVALMAFVSLCIAQTDSVVKQADTLVPVAIDNTVVQRHPSADAVLQIVNMNSDGMPVMVTHYGDRETMLMAKELREELLGREQEVLPLALADTNAIDNPKHYNFTYAFTDSLMVIMAHPRKK